MDAGDQFIELVHRTLQGDVVAHKELIDLLAPIIRARVRWKLSTYKGRNDLSEEDLVQETWLRLLEHDAKALRNYDKTKSRPLTYVGRIAEHAAQDILRRKYGERAGAEHAERIADQGPSVERRVIANDQAKKFHTLLQSRLPERGRLVYALHFVDSKPTRDVARILRVSEQVVHNWIFKIRTLAREFLLEQRSV